MADDSKAASEAQQELQSLYDLMVEEGLDTLEYKTADTRIKLDRRPLQATVAASPVHRGAPAKTSDAARPKAAAASAPVSAENSITSPLAGVFYRTPSPTSPPFCKEGDIVTAGQTLCIVEAMKVMNEIKADKSCRIVKITAENSRPVTAGQVLFHVEPA